MTLGEEIANHLHTALTDAIRAERSVPYNPAALVDAGGVGRLSIWDVAEVAAEAVEIHKECVVWCDYCGGQHRPDQGSWPMEGCPETRS